MNFGVGLVFSETEEEGWKVKPSLHLALNGSV